MSDKPPFDPNQPFQPSEITERAPASAAKVKPEFNPEQPFETGEEHYGTTGQQVLAGIEGAAKGVIGPLVSAAEIGTGLTTGEDIRGRAEANPITHGASEAATFAGSLLVPVLGEASLAGHAANIGEHAAALAGVGAEGAGALSKIASAGVKGGAELATLQASDEASKLIESDPNQSIGSAAINVGLAGILGGVGGAALGSVSPLWHATVGDSTAKMIDGVKAEGAATGIDQKILGESLQSLKPNAPKVLAAAKTLDDAPVLESQISASGLINDLDSHLLFASTSPIAEQRRALLQKGLAKVQGAVGDALGASSDLSRVDVGNAIKESLTNKIEAEAKPISELYDTIKQSTQEIPVSDNAKRSIVSNLKKIEGYDIVGSPVKSLVDNAVENVQNLSSVDAIKRYKTFLNGELGHAASENERYAVGQIAEKLSNLEENSIVRAAESMAEQTQDPAVKQSVLELLSQRQEANAAYKALKEKMGDLGKVLGKKRVPGPQGFIDFVNELTPEALTKKLFSKENSEALQKFTKNFPEESQMLFQHQKNAIREAAMVDGRLDTNKVIRELNKLSPEVKELMFPKEALEKLDAAHTYMESLPDKVRTFGPSGAGANKAHSILKFFTNPISASLMTAGDYGISKIISRVVPKGTLEKSLGGMGEEEFLKNVYPTLHKAILEKETNPGGLKSAIDYSANVFKGQKKLDRSVNSFFKSGVEILGKDSLPDQESRNKLDKSLDHFQEGDNALNVGKDFGHYMPEHAAAAAQIGSVAVNYLNSLRPKDAMANPLDPPMPVNKVEQANYNRALDVAQQPLVAIHHAKMGTLLPIDVQSLQTIYPDLHSKIAQKLQEQIINHTAKGNAIPYYQRVGLSQLIGGAPLDGTMTQQAMQAVIGSAVPAPIPQGNGKKKGGATEASLKQINKVNALYQTPLERSAGAKRG